MSSTAHRLTRLIRGHLADGTLALPAAWAIIKEQIPNPHLSDRRPLVEAAR